MISKTNSWDKYAEIRFLGRHRLLFEHHQEILSDFVQFFADIATDQHIVDIGCSSGFFLVILRELGFVNIEGIDISERFVSRAVSKGLQCKVADIFAENGECQFKGRADVILLMDILEHLEDPGRALKIVAKNMLKDNGIIYVTVPIYDSLSDKLVRLIKGKTKLQQAQQHDPTHLHAFTQQGFHALLRQANLTVVDSKRLFCAIPRVANKKVKTLVNLTLPEMFKGTFLRVITQPN